MTEEMKKTELTVVDGGKKDEDCRNCSAEDCTCDKKPDLKDANDLSDERKVDLNEIAKRKQQEKYQQLKQTSFSTLKGKERNIKLNYMYQLITNLNDNFLDYAKSTNELVEFMMTDVDADGAKFRAYTNKKHNLEEITDGVTIQMGYFFNSELTLDNPKGQPVTIPTGEQCVTDKLEIQFTDFKFSDLIGMRVGESQTKGNFTLKIVKGRRKVVNKPAVKTDNETTIGL